MSPELARPAPDLTPGPAAERRQENVSVGAKHGRIHHFPDVRTGVCATNSWSVPARLYGAYIQARWGGTGVFFEARRALATQFNTSERSIRRWEREGVVAGLWRIEPRGRGRQLVLLKSGHEWPSSPTTTVANHCTTVATGCPDRGQTCSTNLKSNKNSSSIRAAAAEVEPDPLPAPVAEAIADLEALGVGSSSLARIRPRLEATWSELRRRGGEAETDFRASWKVVMERAAAPTVKNTPAWLIKVLLDGDGPIGGFVRPGRVKPTKPVGAANQRFVKPNPEVVHGA